MSRYMTYLWQDKIAEPDYVKYGEHFVEGECTLAEAVQRTIDYVRKSLGPNKNRFDDESVVVHRVWDCSEYAKKKSAFRMHSHVDDMIRDKALVCRVKGSEKHKMTPENAMSAITKELDRHGNPREVVKLMPIQSMTAIEALDAIHENRRIILAELVARFGKTIWSAAVFKESCLPRLVIASYVKTVLKSFENELERWDQFKNFDFIDSQNRDFDKRVKESEEFNRIPVTYISLCQSSKRQERIDTMFTSDVPTFLIIDEADYGSHCENQVTPLIEAFSRNPKNVALIMTGTNSDRAASKWKVSHMMSVTYPELIIEKRKYQK